jgi:hypothetical protein
MKERENERKRGGGLEEGRGTYHVNKHLEGPLPLLDKLGCVVLFPLALLVLAKVAFESLLAPGAVDGVCDGGEGRDGLVFSGVLEELCR